jgi:hypothetical protein
MWQLYSVKGFVGRLGIFTANVIPRDMVDTYRHFDESSAPIFKLEEFVECFGWLIGAVIVLFSPVRTLASHVVEERMLNCQKVDCSNASQRP